MAYSPALSDVTDTSDAGTDPDGSTVTDPGATETLSPLGVLTNDGGDPSEDPTTSLIAATPQLELTKSVSSVVDTNGSGITDAGDTINYSFSVSNTGNVILEPVTFSDAKLGLVDEACVASLAVGDTDIACSTVGLYVIMQTDVEAGGVENVAIATGSPVDSGGAALVDPVTGNPIADTTDSSDTGTDAAGAAITDPETVESPNPLG